MDYLREHEAEAVKLQAQWKGVRQRRAYKERLNFLEEQGDTALKVREGRKEGEGEGRRGPSPNGCWLRFGV